MAGITFAGQDADFAGERIKNFTSAEAGFVGPQISIASMPASWDRAETWNGRSSEGGIPGAHACGPTAADTFTSVRHAVGLGREHVVGDTTRVQVTPGSPRKC